MCFLNYRIVSRLLYFPGFYKTKMINLLLFAALQERLNLEMQKRQQAEASSQEKERQNSMLSVDYRQLQQQLHKLEGEYRQECEKVIVLQLYPITVITISVHCKE